jgi:hypothetical protein
MRSTSNIRKEMMHSISADYVKPLRIAEVLTRMGGDDLRRLSLEFLRREAAIRRQSFGQTVPTGAR